MVIIDHIEASHGPILSRFYISVLNESVLLSATISAKMAESNSMEC